MESLSKTYLSHDGLQSHDLFSKSVLNQGDGHRFRSYVTRSTVLARRKQEVSGCVRRRLCGVLSTPKMSRFRGTEAVTPPLPGAPSEARPRSGCGLKGERTGSPFACASTWLRSRVGAQTVSTLHEHGRHTRGPIEFQNRSNRGANAKDIERKGQAAAAKSSVHARIGTKDVCLVVGNMSETSPRSPWGYSEDQHHGTKKSFVTSKFAFQKNGFRKKH